MKRKVILAAFLCVAAVVLLFITAHAQTTIPNSPTAIKFDHFGDIVWSDLIARLDNFAVELQNEPTAHGHIIFYRSRRDLPGLSSRQATQARNYLVKSRGIDPERLTAIDGGMKEGLSGELWIVPAGAAPPLPTAIYNYPLIDADSSYKFDETYRESPQEPVSSDSNYYLDSSAYLDGFAAALKKQPKARGFVIGYGQHLVHKSEVYNRDGVRLRSDKQVFTDSPDEVRALLTSDKNYLTKKHGINPARIVTVNGGYRKGHNVELWIVPRGERPPVPTPNVYPPRHKRKR